MRLARSDYTADEGGSGDLQSLHEALEAGDSLDVLVAGDERQVVLQRRRSDPDVVIVDDLTGRAQVGPQCREPQCSRSARELRAPYCSELLTTRVALQRN